MKFTNLLPFFGILIILSSCSNNTDQIKNKWWVKKEVKNRYSYDDFIQFTENKIIKLNNRDSEFEGLIEYANNEIILKSDDYSNNIKIIEITDSTLVLESKGDKVNYERPSESDFFVGEWKSNDGKNYKLEFDYSNSQYTWIVKLDNKEWQRVDFWVGDELVFNGERYTYELSEDKNNLLLIVNEVVVYNLVRSSSVPFTKAELINMEEESKRLDKKILDAYKADSLKAIINNKTKQLNSTQEATDLTKSKNKSLITVESGTKKYCLIDGVMSLDGQTVIAVDYIQWIEDDDSPSGIEVKNENTKLRYFVINEKTKLAAYINGGVVQDLEFGIDKLFSQIDDYKNRVWILDVNKGNAIFLRQQYLP